MSSNQRYQRRAIDEAIDRAVGEMMEIDPRPGLRRRVQSRIEKPFGRRALWWRGSFVMLPAAALLLIIVAVVTSRWPESSVEVAQTSAPRLAPLAPLRTPSAPLAPSAAPAVAPAAPAAAAVPPLPSRSDALFGPRRDRVSAASIASSAPASAFVDPIPTVDEAGSLAPAPIVVSPLPQMQELRIAPIEIQRITVPALSPPR